MTASNYHGLSVLPTMNDNPVPAADETGVTSTSKINQIEFLKQIIENIKAQITSVDAEFLAASKENKEVGHNIS